MILTSCNECDDSGYIFTVDDSGNEFLNLCECSKGQSHRKDLFAPSDKERERPITIPTYSKPKPKISGRDRATGDKDED